VRSHGSAVRIALIHYTVPPIVGGVERVVGRHAALMADAGHAVTVIAGRGQSPDHRVSFRPIPLADSLHPRIVRIGKELAAGRVPADFDELVGEIAGDMETALDGVDIAIAHNVASLNRNLALTSALRRVAEGNPAMKLVLWHHDLAWTMPRYRQALHDGDPWDLLRRPWPRATQVAISDARRDDLARLQGIAPDTISVIPGGVDVPAVAGLPAASFDPLLLAPVRITPRKNLELAIRTVAELRRLGRPAGLVVTGPVDPHDSAERSYYDCLVALREGLGLEDAVVFMAEGGAGSPSDSDLPSLYAVSDALLITSLDEGFGLPILEAGAARLPVICSDLPSMRAIAGDAAAYFPADAEPADVAAAVLGRLASDRAGAFAHSIRNHFSWDAVYRRDIEPLIQRTLGQAVR
jgi:glycosyltransferase involved in cell wall biosynthesis